MKLKTCTSVFLTIVCVASVALMGVSTELARRQARYYDKVAAAQRTSITPQGATDLRLSGRKVSNWPPVVGTWVITARGTHTSWTSTPITAIGVDGALELTAGGDDYTDSESDGYLNADEAEATTSVETDPIVGTELMDAEGSAESDHEFFDTRLGGWVYLHTSVSGGL